MTTFLSLATSATMFPASGNIITTPLTPELVKARLAYPELIASALNPSHATTIDVIKRRYDLELPLPVLEAGQRAPQVKLGPGDELFIVQATLPRPKEGEVHSDETVQSAPISFLRWRVPVCVEVLAPRGIPQTVFAQVIDQAYSIALWRSGEAYLKSPEEIKADFDKEAKEYQEARLAWRDSARADIALAADLWLESADVLYKSLCHWFVTGGRSRWPLHSDHAGRETLPYPRNTMPESAILDTVMDVMLLKYARRASGLPKDVAVERALVPLILTR